ncbi:MAG: signal peptidase I [Akkermansia sp.]|nr:signal peptidase I [Akkermansia sp.]
MKRYFLKTANWIADCLLGLLTPGWRRKGVEARNALERYYNYNKPHIEDERKEQLLKLKKRLTTALLYWRKADTEMLTAEISTLGESLRGFKRGALVETVESLFVIMVIFLGIRTYYAQPFRIPTGSMQPSLNGIIIHPIAENEPLPSTPKRFWQTLTLGSSYCEIVSDSAKKIIDLKTERYPAILPLFTRTRLRFSNGSEETVPCAAGAVAEYLSQHGKLGRTLMPGEVILRGRVDAGDMVVVNRMAYHFRKPERGETFVFDTRGINTNVPAGMPDQSNASNYIKRLCGLPGDKIHITQPGLEINDKPATEAGICRVASCAAPYNSTGYNALNKNRDASVYYQAYMTEGNPVTLKQMPTDPNLNEYLALGDNTVNSKDSRYWGPVRQFNILGPAFLTLWPFTEHWGNID